MDPLLQDLRYALRQVRRGWAFSLGAAMTIAIGVGAATAVFSAADHVLLRPMPYRAADRVMTLWETSRSQAGSAAARRPVSPANYLDWEARLRGFESVGLAEPSGFDLTGNGPPEPIAALRVTPRFLSALGVVPMLGRLFASDDYAGAGNGTVILSHGTWLTRFGADSSIVGRSIRLDDAPVLVVGVLPPTLDYPEPTDVWVPKVFRADEMTDRRSAYMFAVGRLRAGISPEMASAELERVAADLATANPAIEPRGAVAIPLGEQVRGPVRPALVVLLGAVGVLLLLACVNLATLMLARVAERRRELAVRAALGAGRSGLIRQLLAEVAVIAFIGAGTGIALAQGGLSFTMTVLPAELSRFGPILLDRRVLLVSILATVGATLIAVLAPLWLQARADPAAALGGGARAVGDRQASRLRSTLVIAQMALAITLLIGAGLLARSLARLLRNDLGFEPRNRAAIQVFLWDRNPLAAQRLARAEEIMRGLQGLPGVVVVGATSALPFHPHRITAQGDLVVTGRAASPDAPRPRVFTTVASPGYFGALGNPLKSGRAFTPGDRLGTPMVAIVNQALARRYFGGESPIGKRVTIGVMDRPVEREIVGVVGDVRPDRLDAGAQPELFVPLAQSGTGSLTFVVHTRDAPVTLLPALRSVVWSVDPGQSIYHVGTMPALIAETTATRRFHLGLLGTFAAIALALAALGVHGLVAFLTSRRTREIGVRMAVGADRRDVVRMIVRQGVALGVPGVVLGLAGAIPVTRAMRPLLYETSTVDAATYLGVAALMAAVVVVASLLPARRAATIDPVVALRAE